MIISVIIPVFKDWKRLSRCLEGLDKQTLSKEEFEILIVNNDPKSKVPEGYCFPANSKLIHQSIPGSYAARNLAIATAKSEYLAFTDSDCIPKEDWLENALELISSGVDLVGGKITLFKPSKGTDLAYIYEHHFSFNQKKNVQEKGQSVTANLIGKRAIFQDIGLFREDLLSGGDFEWTRRATSKGYKIGFGENVIVSHPARKNLKQLVKKRKRTVGGMYFMNFHKFSPKQRLQYTLMALRPRVTIFTYQGIGLKQKFQLFFATWYVEFIGVMELFLLDKRFKGAERL